MKKFIEPEIELIVLDSTDICTTSTPATDNLNSYNGTGEINGAGSTTGNITLDDDLSDMFGDN